MFWELSNGREPKPWRRKPEPSADRCFLFWCREVIWQEMSSQFLQVPGGVRGKVPQSAMVPVDLPALQELELRVTVECSLGMQVQTQEGGQKRSLYRLNPWGEPRRLRWLCCLEKPHVIPWACPSVLVVTFPEMSAFKIPKVSYGGLCVGSFTIKTYFTLKSTRVVLGHKADLSRVAWGC